MNKYYLQKEDFNTGIHCFWVLKASKIVWTFRFARQLEEDYFRQMWVAIELVNKLNTLKVKSKELNKATDLFNKLQREALNLDI